MSNTPVEVLELIKIRRNVRRSVESLELCWACQRICECEHRMVENGPAVWLCQACLQRLQIRSRKTASAALAPVS